MIKFPDGGRLVQSLSELPTFSGRIGRLYLDLETTSGDRKKKSTDPWRDCWVAGIAVTADDCPHSYYVPVGCHRTHWNVGPVDAVQRWLVDILSRTDEWVNHNVKYDVHVLKNAFGIDTRDLPLTCTVVASKILYSDMRYRGGYGLDNLSLRWLDRDISHFEKRMKPYLMTDGPVAERNKDYGWVPADIIGEYACQDVITTRLLDHHVRARMPEECRRVWATERELTRVLVDMERAGLIVWPTELAITELKNYDELMRLDRELAKLTGRSFRPHVNEDCYDVLCNQYGLPVLEWTDNEDESKRNPSFGKHTLAKYLSRPDCPVEVVKRIARYRKVNTFNDMFVRRYRERHVDGVMHSNYNQQVETGRMSSKDPNAQQLDERAKELVHPDHEGEVAPEHGLLANDYASIEFRTIVHYIEDSRAIAAFDRDADTDFHQYVADEIRVKRKPAKTINFLMAFGGGKEKLLKNLEVNPDLVEAIRAEVLAEGLVGNDAMREFASRARRRAETAYDDYHRRFPGMKRVSRLATNAAMSRGYVFNVAGRRRYLPEKRAHIAFNTLNQSSAADILKERTVALWHMLREAGGDIRIIASVHDETLMRGPRELLEDKRTRRDIAALLEVNTFGLRVPIRVACGYSRVNWRQASKGPPEPAPIRYRADHVGRLEHVAAWRRRRLPTPTLDELVSLATTVDVQS